MNISRYLGDAQKRAKRRKSPWNILPFALIFVIGPGLWWLFACTAWYVHTLIHPAHAERWGEFWTDGVGIVPFISSFLMIMPLGLPALTTVMLLSNLLARSIPPVRQALDREAEGHPGTDYKSTQRQMILATKIAIAIAVPLSLIGAATLFRLH